MKEKGFVNYVIVRNLRKYKYFIMAALCLFCVCFIFFPRASPSTAVLDNIQKMNNQVSSANSNSKAKSSGSDLGKDLDSRKATLFLEMPALGDQACSMTLENAFKQAENPDRVFFGVYQQSAPTDTNVECIDFECDGDEPPRVCQYLNNIRINRTDLSGAMGPVYARYMADSLYREHRDFIMIMDSHTMFRQNWDTYLVEMWQSIENERAIITHYPWGAEHLERRSKCFDDPGCDDKWSYHVCGSYFEGRHMPRNANGCHIKDVIKPVLTPFFAAGFSFARSHLRDNVPWDPYQKYVFWGEEFGYGTRAWTHGYDFYSPDKDIVGHWYDKGPRRRSPFVNHGPDTGKIRKAGELRIQYLWGILPEDKEKEAELREIKKYGMGDKRTLDQFWKFAGMDVDKQTITVFEHDLYRTGGLTMVPWK